MNRLHQIVAAIPHPDGSPVVLFDFDEWFKVAQGTDFSPPEVRVSSTWTQLNDGEDWGATTLGDRVLTLKLTAFRGNAEDQAEVLQTLGRLLDDSRGQWFLWQDEGTVHERYFRTKRAALEIEDHLLLENPLRTITIRIPAESAAYGRAILGQTTIFNDPTSPTNPMSFVMPPVKGDLSTPLALENEAGRGRVGMFAAAAAPLVPETPIYATFDADVTTGWTVTFSYADSAAIGGFTSRNVKASGTLPVRTQAFVTAIPPGDWRALVRCRATVAGATITDLRSGVKATIPNTAYYTWVDTGVSRQPISAGHDDGARPSIRPVSAARNEYHPFSVAIAGTAGEIRVDTVLYVPAGLDGALVSTLLRTLGTDATDPGMVEIDSIRDQAYRWEPGADYPLEVFQNIPVEGGFPEVIPGHTNVITMVTGMNPLEADDKDSADAITWLYYPRYLNLRSATG